MGNVVFNIAKGRAAELYRNVSEGTIPTAEIQFVVINTTSADGVLQDYESLAALLADANTAEVTNDGYDRIGLGDADLAEFSVDQINDRVALDLPDQVWVAVQAGDSWSDVVICYSPNGGLSADADIVPLTMHDFEVVPDGRDIPLEVHADGFYVAS